MAKKESPKKEAHKKENNLIPKIPGLSDKAFSIIKFALGICLLPFVYATSVAFLNEFASIEKALQIYFWSGLISLVIIHLFIWEPAIIYNRGHRILEIFFAFFRPLVKVAPYLFPIYTIILFVSYGIVFYISGSKELIAFFIFLIGFSIGLHLVFGAKSLRTKQYDFLKANYIFGFSFVYILNLILLSFCLNLVFKEFSFVGFFNHSFQLAKQILYAVFKQFFIR